MEMILLINLLPNEIEFIRNNLPDADNLLKTEQVNDILDALYDWIDYYGFDSDFELNDKGRIAERIYDSIYVNNGSSPNHQ